MDQAQRGYMSVASPGASQAAVRVLPWNADARWTVL